MKVTANNLGNRWLSPQPSSSFLSLLEDRKGCLPTKGTSGVSGSPPLMVGGSAALPWRDSKVVALYSLVELLLRGEGPGWLLLLLSGLKDNLPLPFQGTRH